MIENPELTSGIGSRGYLTAYKRAILEHLVAEFNPSSILDVGCGDMIVSSVLPEHGYTGIDVSPVIIKINTENYPGRKFLCGDFESMELEKHDLVLCMELLIHIPDKTKYQKYIAKCVNDTNSVGAIAAYEHQPAALSDITFFHESIRKTLAAAGAINIKEIGSYNQVRVFQFQKSTSCTLRESLTEKHQFKKPIFLVGTMRSGTTLLADLLGRSPHIAHCPFELKDVWSQKGGIHMASPKTRDHTCPEYHGTDVTSGMRKALIQGFFSRMAALPGKSENAVFLNKNPHLCNKLELVKALFPDARFIWVHRHLPQVVASLKMLFADICQHQSTWHWWPLPSSQVRNRCWNAYYSCSAATGVALDRVFPGGNVRYLAEYWLENNRAIVDFFSKTAAADCIRVAQEEFIASPNAQLAHLYGLLQVPFFFERQEKMDISRNNRWLNLLDKADMYELQKFIEERSQEINEVFPNEDRPLLYIKWLNETCQGGE